MPQWKETRSRKDWEDSTLPAPGLHPGLSWAQKHFSMMRLEHKNFGKIENCIVQVLGGFAPSALCISEWTILLHEE